MTSVLLRVNGPSPCPEQTRIVCRMRLRPTVDSTAFCSAPSGRIRAVSPAARDFSETWWSKTSRIQPGLYPFLALSSLLLVTSSAPLFPFHSPILPSSYPYLNTLTPPPGTAFPAHLAQRKDV
ncbi:hypothetical protein B0H19DRAFT_1245918 [Mycena capillaripes]|nr:hypothetical protein B0H19DRAFT_1245918 [Mycena capillaripes]